MKTPRSTESRERVFLVGVGLKRASHVPGIDAGEAERASLLELAELARSAGAHVTGSIFQMRDKIDPATMIGSGKIEELKIEANLHKAPLIVFVHQSNVQFCWSGVTGITAARSGGSVIW